METGLWLLHQFPPALPSKARNSIQNLLPLPTSESSAEWGDAIFPMVPGHEIVGRVTAVGARVTRLKVGDVAGVGCMVDSCRTCDPCRADFEQFCEKGVAFTYNGTGMEPEDPHLRGLLEADRRR